MGKHKILPLKALIKEAELALRDLQHSDVMERDGRRFSFSLSGDKVQVQLQRGSSQLGCDSDTTYEHLLEISPTKMQAFFYEYCDPEKRKLIEPNLTARGYSVSEKDGMWFNSSKKDRYYKEVSKLQDRLSL